jgi:NodT family efflux transporter outer membrane factor (OMF) lipoprotein
MRRQLVYYLFLLAILCLSLQACFVARKYDRPELEMVDSLYRTDLLPEDSVSLATISWRSIFTDTLLSSYIEEGLENNLDIRIALQRLMAAEAYMKQGKAAFFPSLEGRASMTHQELSGNSQFGSFFDGSIQQFELTGSFSWEADIWGKIRSSRRASLATYLQQQAAHKAVKTQLVAQIASSYYQLLALDEQQAITRQTIENRERSLETIRALKEAGNVTQVAVDQAAAQVYNSEALLVDLEIDIFRLENTLGYLLGRPGEKFARGSLENQQYPKEPTLGVPAMLLRNRPDVIASEYSLINAFELINVARSDFYPSFMITGTGGFQSLEFDQWFDAGSLFANLVGSLTQPLFNRRQIRTQYEVARSQQEESLLTFKKTLLLAGQEVSNALYEYQAETRKYTFRQQEVEALRRAEIHSEALLKNGFGTYLDLLTARQNALNAELNGIDNKEQQLQAIVELYRALGGGWQ